MEMSNTQRRYFKLGKKLAEEYVGYSMKNALQYAMNDNDWFDIFDSAEWYELNFLSAGFNGFEPRYVKAYRYGEIPACGRSTNWASREYENGVSCVCFADSEPKETVYDHIYGIQGIEKITIAGWYLGKSGADGEPLLQGVIKL